MHSTFKRTHKSVVRRAFRCWRLSSSQLMIQPIVVPTKTIRNSRGFHGQNGPQFKSDKSVKNLGSFRSPSSVTFKESFEEEEDSTQMAIEWQTHTGIREIPKSKDTRSIAAKPAVRDLLLQSKLIELIRKSDHSEVYAMARRFTAECDLTNTPADYLETLLSIYYRFLDYDGFEKLLSFYLGSTQVLAPSVINAALKIYFKRGEFDMAKAFFHQYVIISEKGNASVLYVYMKSAYQRNCSLPVYLSAYKLWMSKSFSVSLSTDCLLTEILEHKGSEDEALWFQKELQGRHHSASPVISAISFLKKSLLQTNVLEDKIKVVDQNRALLASQKSKKYLEIFYSKVLKHFASFGNLEYLNKVVTRIERDQLSIPHIVTSRVSVYYVINEEPAMLLKFFQQSKEKGISFSPVYFHRYWESLLYSYPSHGDVLLKTVRECLAGLNSSWAKEMLKQLQNILQERKTRDSLGSKRDFGKLLENEQFLGMKTGDGYQKAESDQRGTSALPLRVNSPGSVDYESTTRVRLAKLDASISNGINPAKSSLKKVLNRLHPSDYEDITRLSAMISDTYDRELILNSEIVKLKNTIANMSIFDKAHTRAREKLNRFTNENWETLRSTDLLQLAVIALKVKDYQFAIRLGSHAFDTMVNSQSVSEAYNNNDRITAYTILLNAHLKTGNYEQLLLLLDQMQKDNKLVLSQRLIGHLETLRSWLVRYTEKSQDEEMNEIKRRIVHYMDGVIDTCKRRFQLQASSIQENILDDVKFFQSWAGVR
ncbi:unnamed protein product [Kuraishia capsulata CBS 1993]|uniref:Mitochondrial group I intron splicing factor CCM1 n=1 Tax=Kuraishia capsulata CBS 1993 TaxID=1382522 RepID=W6MIT5_9ASCO|nr:uncharacterized protein KUCA_T00002381001 [Kuraishia capsulata CBS 1993]CDK26409.1 unnamed protein product [Kuraishia capsulata CBS 1993]